MIGKILDNKTTSLGFNGNRKLKEDYA